MSFGLSLILCVFGRDLREAQILLASLRFAQTCDGVGAGRWDAGRKSSWRVCAMRKLVTGWVQDVGGNKKVFK